MTSSTAASISRVRSRGSCPVLPARRREEQMAHWLVKSEPSTWSLNDQMKAGAKGTAWDGVRNFQARENLKKMKKGDSAFFYHTGEEKRVVGIVEVIGEYRPDPTDNS